MGKTDLSVLDDPAKKAEAIDYIEAEISKQHPDGAAAAATIDLSGRPFLKGILELVLDALKKFLESQATTPAT